MGSLSGYDILRSLEQDSPSVQVDHFVTIGSPLGLAQVRLQIVAEHGVARTPDNVNQWSNRTDKRDLANVASKLSRSYGSSNIGIKIRDVEVLSKYRRPNGGLAALP